ncbi:Rhamnulose-1-phosphate aldolase [Klebsiella pneumoniae]|nr:Rhamnulose-1-phosphate aldolase [Klebsiella pneumoniae]
MQTIIDAWFVQGMIKATSDAWLKGWDERNGGNLTLRLDEADIEPYAADFHAQPRYIALSQPWPTSRLSSPAPANSSVTSSSTRPLTSAW